MYFGSICLSDMNEQAKKSHPAFTRGKNGKIYVNIVQWFNGEPDQYGNIGSLSLSKPKDSELPNTYIGNMKAPLTDAPLSSVTDDEVPADDDLPF